MPCLPAFVYPAVGGIFGVGLLAAAVYAFVVHRARRDVPPATAKSRKRANTKTATSERSPKPSPDKPSLNKLDESVLPDGWEKHTDDDGEVYFHNPVTSQTSWSRPEDSTPRKATKGKKKKKSKSKETHVVTIDHVSSISEDLAGPVSVQLPTGWEELQDAEGQTYYYNDAQRRTSWTKPDMRSTRL